MEKAADFILPKFLKAKFNHVNQTQNFCNHSSKCLICNRVKPILIDDSIKKLDMHRLVKASGKYNFECKKIPVNSKFNTNFMRRMLHGYNDLQVCELLKYGFPIGFVSDTKKINKNSKVKNHKGAVEFPKEIEKYLMKEASFRAIMGPFKNNPFTENIILSPLNSVPKSLSERRIILDLSFPKKGNSVNSYVPKDQYLGDSVDLFFPNVDDFTSLILAKGQGALLYKLDLRRAYRQISICPSDYNLVAFKWKNHIFCDTVLPMGLRSSAHICQRVTNAFSFMMLNIGLAVLNYLDDFGGVEQGDVAWFAFSAMRNIFLQSGLEEALDKACEPSERMVFLGILFDTIEMNMSIPLEKLNQTRALVFSWLFKSHATLKDLQSLLGKLNFVGACVKSSRVFVNRILNWLRQCYSDDMHTSCMFKIPEDVKKDLFWWNQFLPIYNGISLIDHGSWSEPDLIFSSDSCLSGCGGFLENKYFHSEFPAFIIEQNLHISALELLSVIVCFHVWGVLMKGKKIQIYCDNMAACIVINSGKAKCPFLQNCLRELCYWTSLYDIHFRAVHLEGSQNRLADYLSRFHLDNKFKDNFFFSCYRYFCFKSVSRE